MSRDSWFARHRLVVCWSAALAVQSLLVVAGICDPLRYGYATKMPLYSDVQIYYDYARPILYGAYPYREYSVEYPILAIVVFFIPFVAGSSFEVYRVAFIIQMMIVNALTLGLVARHVARTEGSDKVPLRLIWYTAYFAALCPLIVVRFDMVPMALAFASVVCATRKRMGLAGVLAGVGMLVKLVPVLVLPPILVQPGPWRPREKMLMGLLGSVVFGVLPWWLLGEERMIDSFRYHGLRGLEIGSLYSSGYLVAHKVTGLWIMTTFGYGGMNIVGNGSKDAATLSTVVVAAMLVLVVARARKAGPGHEFRFAAASLLAYIAFGKVLSPQYLIWLLPFFCVLPGKRGQLARYVYFVCCGLTTLVFPYLFQALCFFDTVAVCALVARNLSLLALFWLLIGSTPVTPTQSSPAACS